MLKKPLAGLNGGVLYMAVFGFNCNCIQMIKTLYSCSQAVVQTGQVIYNPFPLNRVSSRLSTIYLICSFRRTFITGHKTKPHDWPNNY